MAESTQNNNGDDIGTILLNSPFPSLYEEMLLAEHSQQQSTGFMDKLRALKKPPIVQSVITTETVTDPELPEGVFSFSANKGYVGFGKEMYKKSAIEVGSTTSEDDQYESQRALREEQEKYGVDPTASYEDQKRQAEDVIDAVTVCHKKPIWFKAASDNNNRHADDLDYYHETSLPAILQEEILDFTTFLRPTQAERKMRQYLLKRITTVVHSLWPECTVKVFGSFETELYLPTSDMDIVILDGPAANQTSLTNLRDALRANKMIFEHSDEIVSAKVSLVKFVDSVTQFPVDVSFSISGGVSALELMNKNLRRYPALRPLTLIIKQFLLMRGLNEVYSGGLGSFGLTSMITSFLQMHPMIQSEQIQQEKNVGVLLIEFFELYGKRFNYEEVGIDVKGRGGYFPKLSRPVGNDPKKSPRYGEKEKLCVQDPGDDENDICRGSFNLRTIRSAFSHAFDVLCACFYENEYRHQPTSTKSQKDLVYSVYSILGTIVDIPEAVIAHREHVENMYSEMKVLVDKSVSNSDIDNLNDALKSTIDEHARGDNATQKKRKRDSDISNVERYTSRWDDKSDNDSDDPPPRQTRFNPPSTKKDKGPRSKRPRSEPPANKPIKGRKQKTTKYSKKTAKAANQSTADGDTVTTKNRKRNKKKQQAQAPVKVQ